MLAVFSGLPLTCNLCAGEHTGVSCLPSQSVLQPQSHTCSFSRYSVSSESSHLMPGDLTSSSQIEPSGIICHAMFYLFPLMNL